MIQLIQENNYEMGIVMALSEIACNSLNNITNDDAMVEWLELNI